MKRFNLILLSCFCNIVAFASPYANDSLPSDVNELREVVVRTKRSWVEGNKAVFVPTKSEKNLSTDPASLIESMHLPVVRVIDGKIKSLNGDDVAIYINGIKADPTDLSTFWPKQTTRVEYILNSTDPRYEGAVAVINFIMTEYGGVTKVNADQTFPNSGDYDVSSKLVYRRMTYGLQLKGGYMRDHLRTVAGSESFRDVYHDGIHYDEITRSYEGNSWTRSDDLGAVFNARYINGTTRITHMASLSWSRNPGSGSNYREAWSPSLFDAESSVSRNNSRSLSPYFSGQYQFSLRPKWGLSLAWGYSYTRNRSNSLYCIQGSSPIVNDITEDVHYGGIMAYPYAVLSSSLSVAMQIQSVLTGYRDRYSGSAETDQTQLRGSTSVQFIAGWKISNDLQMAFRPGLSVDYWKVGSLDRTVHVQPTGRFDATWAVNRSLMANASLFFNMRSPSASSSADVTVRENELTWVAGNPSLRNFSSWRPDIYVSWMPLDWLNFFLSVNYGRYNNEFISVYRQAPSDLGGVIRTNANADPLDTGGADFSVKFRLFDRKLSVNLQPNWRYYSSHGEYASRHGWFRMRADADYRIGNTSIGVWYGGPEKYLADGGMNRTWNDDSYGMSFTYGNGNLYVNVSASNIFESRRHRWTSIGSRFYSSFADRFDVGRSVSVRVSYTFGYGKKVDPGISIGAPAHTESGIVGSGTSSR